jgi:hypothetical protein
MATEILLPEGQESVSSADVLPRIKPFTAWDRCCAPNCGAQAYIGVLLSEDNEAPLLFCGHHWKKNSDALLALSPFEIRDDIALLSNEERTKGSAN